MVGNRFFSNICSVGPNILQNIDLGVYILQNIDLGVYIFGVQILCERTVSRAVTSTIDSAGRSGTGCNFIYGLHTICIGGIGVHGYTWV